VSGREIRILVVDDHALVREMLATRLAAEDFLTVVGAVADADAAVATAGQTTPDVVLMDIDMPGMSAFDAVREIKALAPCARILFLSGYLNDSYIEQALVLEASGFLSKSESIDSIVAAVRAVARGRVCFSPEVQKRLVVDAGGARLATARHSRIEMLTDRERQILRYLAQGLTKKEIARVVGISPKTVDQHSAHLMGKLDIHDRVELARFAIREGLLEP